MEHIMCLALCQHNYRNTYMYIAFNYRQMIEFLGGGNWCSSNSKYFAVTTAKPCS